MTLAEPSFARSLCGPLFETTLKWDVGVGVPTIRTAQIGGCDTMMTFSVGSGLHYFAGSNDCLRRVEDMPGMVVVFRTRQK